MTEEFTNSQNESNIPENKVTFVYLSEMYGEQTKKTEHQLRTYRDELFKYLSFGDMEQSTIGSHENNISNNKQLHQELSFLIQITTKK